MMEEADASVAVRRASLPPQQTNRRTTSGLDKVIYEEEYTVIDRARSPHAPSMQPHEIKTGSEATHM